MPQIIFKEISHSMSPSLQSIFNQCVGDCSWPTKQGFWYFARSRTRYFREIPWNSQKKAKYREVHQKYFQIHVGKTYLTLILAIRPVLFTPNVRIYLETSSLQRQNVPKLPGVLRWTLRKTGHLKLGLMAPPTPPESPQVWQRPPNPSGKVPFRKKRLLK